MGSGSGGRPGLGPRGLGLKMEVGLVVLWCYAIRPRGCGRASPPPAPSPAPSLLARASHHLYNCLTCRRGEGGQVLEPLEEVMVEVADEVRGSGQQGRGEGRGGRGGWRGGRWKERRLGKTWKEGDGGVNYSVSCAW